MSTGAQESFEEWLRVPVPYRSPDPRFEVRRALEDDFEEIYDLVDDAFGFKRSAAEHDWLYRRNPGGKGRCWIIVERETGRIIGSDARWPWPIARGDQLLPAAVCGDDVIAPRWQRQGLSRLRRDVWYEHPWGRSATTLWWPNEKSRAADQKYGNDVERLMGPLTKGVLLLRPAHYLARHRWPRPFAAAAGTIAAAVQVRWQRALLRGGAGPRVEQVRRFDSSFDDLLWRCVPWHAFWCPRRAEFLNWRYLEHPGVTYAALAALDGDGAAGYCVLRIDGDAAALMELVAPRRPRGVRRALLSRAISTARAAGCDHLQVAATPQWPHWTFLRRVGFVWAPSDLHFSADGPHEPEVYQLVNWQCGLGDVDSL